MLNISAGTLENIEQDFFGFDRESQSTESLETQLIEAQKKVIELIEALSNRSSSQRFSLDENKLRAIQKQYPFLQAISATSGRQTITINCRDMPLYLTASNTSLGEQWHAGTLYASAPLFCFDIVLRPPSTGSCYRFSNVTRPLASNYRVYLEENGHPKLNFQPLSGSNETMSHPHTDENRHQFSHICNGTNPFANLFCNGIRTPSNLYRGLEYLLLWLQTGHFLDWYGGHICQQYSLITPSVSRSNAQTLSQVYVQVREMVVKAIQNYLEDPNHPEFPLGVRGNILEAINTLIELELVQTSDSQFYRVEAYGIKSALSITYNRWHPFGRMTYDALFDLIDCHQLAYSSMLLAWFYQDDVLPSNLRSSPIQNLIINDLMPPNYTTARAARYPQLDKVMAAPMVLRKYCERNRNNNTDWVRNYLPEELEDGIEGFSL